MYADCKTGAAPFFPFSEATPASLQLTTHIGYDVPTLYICCRRMKVLVLALWSSRKEIGLLILIILISSAICGPVIYYCDLVGLWAVDSNRMSNIDSAAIGECDKHTVKVTENSIFSHCTMSREGGKSSRTSFIVPKTSEEHKLTDHFSLHAPPT